MKQVVFPILFFLFGVLLYALEDYLLGFVPDASGLLINAVNVFNIIILIAVMAFMFYTFVIPMYKKMTDVIKKYLFIGFNVIAFPLVAYYWITTLVWK